MPVHDEEWDGDFPISEDDSQSSSPTRSSEGADDEASGTLVFQGDGLPWTVGRYEVRYHHDGMYNVLALDGPLEIYGVCFLVPAQRSRLIELSGPPGKSRF
jgi:phosphatidylethanolamine N-methyltransferase